MFSSASAVVEVLDGLEDRTRELDSGFHFFRFRSSILGTIMDSISLAQRFSTSRTPVREALIALERHDSLEIEPRRRPRVKSLTSDEVTEVYELRAVLHGLIAREVALRRSDDDLLLLEDSLQRMRDAGDTNDFFWSQVQFHDRAAGIARDATLKRVTYGLGLQVLRLRRTGIGIGDRRLRSLSDHERLLVAYRESDADLALALERSLVLAALTLLKRHERV